MATNSEIVISKGGYSVTVYTTKVVENRKNTLIVIPIPQSPNQASNGPKDVKIVDLLRLTTTFVINGYITKNNSTSAKTIKNNLIAIAEGAGIDGGTSATLTYEDTSINVFIEDLSITKIINDDYLTNNSGEDSAEYEISLTLVKGKNTSGV